MRASFPRCSIMERYHRAVGRRPPAAVPATVSSSAAAPTSSLPSSSAGAVFGVGASPARTTSSEILPSEPRSDLLISPGREQIAAASSTSSYYPRALPRGPMVRRSGHLPLHALSAPTPLAQGIESPTAAHGADPEQPADPRLLKVALVGAML